MPDHQQKQRKVIDQIERQINTGSLQFTTVSPVEDYENDSRVCLTSVHFPKAVLLGKIRRIIEVLKEIEPGYYYYPEDCLHMTIKNIRVVNDPPHFTFDDIKKAENVFDTVIQKHKKFNVYFYRLLLFPNNLALIGTTDAAFDDLLFDLDNAMNIAGIADDKKYSNSQFFFSNITLARFANVTGTFKRNIEEISKALSLEPYTVDSVTLLRCNAVCKKRQIINTWELR